MALVVFLKGVNVGGHRRLRPSVLARQLGRFDVVSIGATGTFIVRKPVSRAKLRAEIARRMPFPAEIIICDGAEIRRLTSSEFFARPDAGADIIHFVSVLATRSRRHSTTPQTLPPQGQWCVKVLECRERFVLGIHRREMKAIGYLGQLESVFGAPLTTRSRSTILTIARLLSLSPTETAGGRPARRAASPRAH